MTAIAILGAGAWGTALACHLAARAEVLLWCRDAAQADAMTASRVNARYLAGATLPPSIEVRSGFDDVVARASLVIVATPVAGLRQTFTRLAEHGPLDGPIVWLAKGLEVGSGLLPHEISAQCLQDGPRGVLSGPSFAKEIAEGLPSALVAASTDSTVIDALVRAAHHGPMRIYGSPDLVGVEVAGAMKNVIAIAAGICDGLRLGANARAALITRGLAEIARLGAALGARPETFMGLAGMGDLILTCSGDLSRNRRVGLGLAADETLADIQANLGHVAEGVPCAGAAVALGQRLGVELPIARAVLSILREDRTPRQALAELIARDARPENSA